MKGQRPQVSVVNTNGVVNALGDVNVFTSTTGITAWYELVDGSGKTIAEGQVALASGAQSLGAAIVASSSSVLLNAAYSTIALAWAAAVGMNIQPSADIVWNCGGSTDDGSTLALAPRSSSLRKMKSTVVTVVGLVGGV